MLGPAAALTLAASPHGAASAGAAVALLSLGMGLSALSASEGLRGLGYVWGEGILCAVSCPAWGWGWGWVGWTTGGQAAGR